MVAIAGAAVAAVGVGASMLGSSQQNKAATKARRAQETAATQELEWNRHMWSQEQVNREPWLRAGRDALTNMNAQAEWTRDNPQNWYQRGTVDPRYHRFQAPETPDPNQYRYTPPGVPTPGDYRFNPQEHQYRGPEAVSPEGYKFDPSSYAFDSSRNAYNPRQALDASQYRYTPQESESLGRFDFKPPEVTDDPGYAFRLKSGQEAIESGAAARGGLTSGATLKALGRYGQDLGSQEYQAAYGRSWQQQQEAYDRSRFANMTGEERARYADATRYARDWTSDVTQEERDRYANSTAYGRDLQGNQMAYERGLTGNQMDWQRAQEAQKTAWEQGLTGTKYNADLAWRANEADWNRNLAAQQEQFRQGSYGSEQDWARNWQAQQEQYNRGLTGNQMDWQRAIYENETSNQRAWQEYGANIAERERNWNQWATMAGYGMNQQNQLGQLGANYAQGINSAYAQMGNAQAAGATAQGNAWQQGLQGATSSMSSALNNYMMWSAFNNQTGKPATASPTSGTLPTTWAAYNAGSAQGLYGGQ